jgi:vancomycin resistance protein YoaR
MNVTERLGSAHAGARAIGLPLPPPSARLARIATLAFLGVVLFIAAGAAGLGLYASSHAGRIYEGVHVGDLNVSGLTPNEASEALDRHFTAYAATPLTLVAGDQTFHLAPADIGARLDNAATVDAAMAWGRDGSLFAQSQAWARALVHGIDIAPVIAIDPARARDRIAAFAPEIVKPASNAALTFDTTGRPAIVPDITGVRLDYAGTAANLVNRIAGFASDPVEMVITDDPARVTAAALAPNLPDVSTIVDAPLTISAGDLAWHIPPAELQPLVVVDPGTTQIHIDERPLQTLVQNLASQVDRPASDAALTVDDNGRLAVVPSVTAAEVDIDASVSAISAGLLAGKDAVPLVVHETPPQISDAMAATAVDKGEAMMQSGIVLTWNGGEGQLDRADLLRALTIHSRPGEQEPFVFGLDPDLVRESLGRYAATFDVPERDARWKLNNGKIELAAPESTGRALDLDKGVESVIAAFTAQKPKVELSVLTLKPRWTSKDTATIALGNDVLGEGGTYYGDSSDARRQNINIASSYLSGWLVPPDGIFSYADSVPLITEENGFVTGYGIVDDGHGGFTTAPVVGGGICQVSTTLFQAAFWAGLPMVERHQHPYYLRTYGEAVTGLPGLDAMVNIEPDWRIDLRFRNTTGNWIAVVLIPDGSMLYARILGTNPGWDVEVPDPVISNEVQPDTTMRYTESPEYPLGTEIVVETAREGFDVTINRTVKDGDTVILQDSFFSSFAPAHNTTMRGTGTG